jgi:catechol 2,3-dioxygenase-like lactoylglutathione lyase family enzyme
MNFRLENITPILRVTDMAVSLAFYVDLLGFQKADWGDENFTGISRDNLWLHLCKGGQGNPGTWVWIGVDGDINHLHKELQSLGVKIKLPPTNFWWAYEMQIEDPDGHVLRVGTEPNEELPYEAGF